MPDLKVRGVRGTWVHFPVRVTFKFFKSSRDCAESTESIEPKTNYEKTQMSINHRGSMSIEFLMISKFDRSDTNKMQFVRIITT